VSTSSATHSWQAHHEADPCRCPRRVEAVGLSDVGCVRLSNEDAYALVPDAGLFIIADGMGGHAAGEVASQMAVEAVRSVFEVPELTWPRCLPTPALGPGLPLLRASIVEANTRVHAASFDNLSLAGMGTTLTALLLRHSTVAIGHVGDSRAYRLRGGKLEQLTRDHTFAALLVRGGHLTPEEGEASELAHVLTSAVGTEPAVDIELHVFDVLEGDTFLLATDGLQVVSDEVIGLVLLAEPDLSKGAAELVRLAKDAGGPDNITVVLVRIG
jgi:PPM family protein phosphatase